MVKILQSKGWYWHAVVVGNDIIVRGAIATWFGGAHDPQDNGKTASGMNTKTDASIEGCALPMRGFAALKSLSTSPLPKFPWKTMVRVATPDHLVLDVPLIDLGPGKTTNHAIDLTVAAFQKLGGDLKEGILSVDYQILGGAKYWKPI